MIMTGFGERSEVTHPLGGPKLAGAFEPALLLPTRRFHRPRANRPAAPVPFPVVHPFCLARKIVLFAPEGFARRTRPGFESGELMEQAFFFSVAQLVPPRLHPPGGGGFVRAVKGSVLTIDNLFHQPKWNQETPRATVGAWIDFMPESPACQSFTVDCEN